MTSREETLARLLATYSVFHRPRKPFVLSSGKTSAFYFDCRRTTMLPEAMPLIGRLYSQGRGQPIAAFSVRKDPKVHGMQRWVEGAAGPKSRVAVVEDVVTTGESTLRAIARCREEGFRVERVVALVDREEGGMQRIGAEVGEVRASALYRRSEIDSIWKQVRKLSR